MTSTPEPRAAAGPSGAPRGRRRSFAAVVAGALASGFTIGMATPLISIALERRDLDAALIGANAAMPAVAILLAGPLVPRVVRAIGAVGAAVAGVLLSAAALIAFPFADGVPAWFALRFLLGVGIALHWIVSETWVSQVAEDASRGRAVAVYATLWGAGIAGGPQVLAVVGDEGILPFLVSAGLIVLALPPLALARGVVPDLGRSTAGRPFRGLLRASPLAFLAAFVSGFAETAVLSLLPVYGLRLGLGSDSALLMVTVFAAGSLVMQPPLGWVADRVDRATLLGGAAVLGLAGAVLLPASVGSFGLMWPLLFVWGGAVVGFYMLGLTVVGRSFSGAALTSANVLFIMAYTVGSLAGPAAGGLAMDRVGPVGLPAVLGAVFVVLLVPAVAARRRPPGAGSP